MVQGVVSYNNMNNMSFPSSAKWSVISLVFLATVVVAPLTWANHESKKSLPNIPGLTFASEGASAPVKPSPVAQNNTGAETDGALAVTIETPAVEVESQDSRGSSQQEEIDAYIRTIFGKDAKVFTAITRVECNPKNKQYPACVYHTEHEYSVGVAQINLFNKSHAIHAAKVPGDTMEEKIESLKDPYINVLVAYKIFTDSGFAPWAGYTSGRYLDHMAE